MARGFIGGALAGGVLSLAVATVASVLAPPPNPPRVDTTAPETVAAPPVPETSSAATGGSQVDAPVQTSESAPQTSVPDAESPEPAEEIARAPAVTPPVSSVPGLETPDSLPEAGGVAVEGDDPVLPNPQALAPMLPQPADGVAIDTATAPPPLPQPETAETDPVEAEASPPDMAEVDDSPIETDDAETRVPQDDATADVAPATDTTPETETAEAAQPDGETAQDETPIAEAPQDRVEVTPVTPPATETPTEPETADAEAEEEDSPQVAMIAPSARPQIGTPGITLTDRNNGVVVNRLGISSNDAEPQPVTIITEEGATNPNQDARPIARHAEPFANPESKPLMSIVLIDNGTGPTTGRAGLAALQNFPNAITFAVDSSLPDAADRMALYRAEGFEVLAMIDLPSGAQATDVETTLGVTLAQMGEVVGVLEGTDAGLQGSRVVADQVTAILAETGHGLVTQDRGLNTMPKLARKEGVPATPIFRDFDSKDQTATVIRRFLDQAAFKAGQEGAVIMLGRLRPDTISALLLWGLQDRAGSVALAPISAVLTREDAS